jgi:choline transport protein
VFGLNNGGTAGLLYMYIMCAVGFFFVVLSMAEMASMAPTAGGQYHWVSEFAPKSIQRYASYLVGWLCVLGWQTGSASSAFLAGEEILGLAILNNPDYVYKPWHLTLVVIAVTFICAFFNTFLARKLPLIEGIVLVLHILGFFAILIPMWILAPRTDSKTVWTGFNNGGWSSTGVSVLVGMISPVVSLIGSDSATHMAEEVRDAGRVIPMAMITTVLLNGGLGFVMLVTLCYTLGDVDAVLASPTGEVSVPFIAVFANGVQSNAGASVMTAILLTLSTFCAMTNIAASSRQLFAFARDKAVPGYQFFAAVRPGWDIPANAVIATVIFSCVLALINIGSTIAYNNITSLGLGALISSYIICIGCVALLRIRGKPLLPSRFSLGKFGLVVNLISLAFLLLVFVFIFFPAAPHPTTMSMNWAVLIYGGVLILALVYFLVWGRKVYFGPVEYTRKLD